MHTLPMHTLPMLAFFVALWLALGTDMLRAQSNPTCNTQSRDRAMGTLNGDLYTVADGDNPWQITQRFCLSPQQANYFMSLNKINPSDPDIAPGQQLRIPGLAPVQQAGCSVERLSIDTPRPGGTIEPTFRIEGSGCKLPSNEIVLYMGDRPDHGQRVGSVRLTGGRWGEGKFDTQLTTSRPPGSQVWLYASSGSMTTTPFSVTVIGPQPACAARRLEITAPQPYPAVRSAFEIAGSAGANCTVTVDVHHSRLGYLGEKAIFTGAGSNWRTSWTLRAGSVPGDTVFIDAAITELGLQDTVRVAVDAGPVGYGFRSLVGERCTLLPNASFLPTHAYPDGPQVNTLAPNTNIQPRMVVYHNGGYWFAISRNPQMPDEWVDGDGMRVIDNCYP